MPSFRPTILTVLSVAAGFVTCLMVAAHGQAISARPELLSGPWELASPSGVDGIFVRVYQAIDRDDRRTIKRQTIHVRVYQRRDGHETRRSYAVSPADPTNVILQNESPSFSFYSQFSGDLSTDRNSMAGRWNSRPARWTFRRIR